MTYFTENMNYECYDWTEEDKQKFWINGVYHFNLEKPTCEAYPGYIFTQGDDTMAPGCGGCWCCKPAGTSHNKQTSPRESKIFYDSFHHIEGNIPASILYKSTEGRYRPVNYPGGPITARCKIYVECLLGSALL